MNTIEVKGNWNEQKGKLKQKFEDLVNDEKLILENHRQIAYLCK